MSIFFNFEVGATGRRFRRAVDGDKFDIYLLEDKESEILFGRSDVGCLIELSALSICLINEEKEVVGFMALSDRPNLPAVDPADWETWIRNMFQRFYLSRNTLFIHYMCCAGTAAEYFLEEALVSVFNNDVYLQQIVLIIPPGCPEDILLKHQIIKKKKVYRYYAKGKDETNSSNCLLAYVRQEFCPKMKIRRAVEEDNDDIVEILQKKCPRLKDMYGDYYISELIGRHPESKRRIIVTEFQDQLVGVMCLNTDINYKKLDATYDIRPYYSLMKPTPLEKEKAKRENVLLQTFGEPIMIGKWSPFQKLSKIETNPLEEVISKESRKNSKVYFGQKSTRKNLDDIINSHLQSDDLSEKEFNVSPSHSQATIYSVTDLFEEDSFDYEIVNIDKQLLIVPDVMSFSKTDKKTHWRETKLAEIKKRRLRLHRTSQSKAEKNDTYRHEGEPNAFMIELVGFDEDVHERHVFDLLEAAFELMKIFDYCIIEIPCSEKTLPLLQHFCFVPTKPNICSKNALYVAHRAAIHGKLRVREAEIFDIPQIANLLKDLDGKETLWTIENSIHHKDTNRAYVFLSALNIVGVGILELVEQTDFIRARYNLGIYHNHKYHYHGNGITAGFMNLKVVQAYSVFEVHFRFFLREMMRLSASSTVLWLTAYRNKLVASKANSFASSMIPIMPRKSEIDFINVPESMSLTFSSQENNAFAVWFLGRKFASVPKVDINTRIVIIGASRTAMAFLNELIFSDASSYLNFTSVTLISPNGLNYIRQSKPIVEMMFSRNRTNTDRFLKCVPYTYYVNIIHGTMIDIDKQNKCVTLYNCSKCHYDLLFLFVGKQYQQPNYLNAIYEKETIGKCANPPPYVRLDVPRYIDSDIRIANEKLPENVFIVNNKMQANIALDYVKNLTTQNSYTILVYGASIHAYCCLSALLELKVQPENISFIEPFPPEDIHKTRVPVFCNSYVDQTVKEMLDSLKIQVYRSYYFQSWITDQHNLVTHVNFLSYFQRMQLECSALFYYGKRGISVETLRAISRSGIIYDGGILIDHEFRTNDLSIYAAGSATRYCPRYFADVFQQKYYESYEVGTKLGNQIRNQLDSLFSPNKHYEKRKSLVRFTIQSDFLESYRTSYDFGDSINSASNRRMSKITEEIYPILPVFKRPKTIYCTLPGGLKYLEVHSPGLKVPNYYVQTLEYSGFVMETFKDGYFKLHFTKDYIVDGITCLSCGKHSIENFKNIYGLSAVVLNNVHLRYTTMRLDNLYEFFGSPWAFFLYHEQCDELFSMVKELRPKGQSKGNTLGEVLMAVTDKLGNPSFRSDTKMKIKSMFEHSAHIEAITDYVMEWLSENDVQFPMYLHPTQLALYHHDLASHPAFKKKKTSLIKLFREILNN